MQVEKHGGLSGSLLRAIAGLVADHGIPFERAVVALREETVKAALEVERGHQGRAAKRLAIHRNTFDRWLAEFKIEPREYKVLRAHRRAV